jgi:DNA polymerase
LPSDRKSPRSSDRARPRRAEPAARRARVSASTPRSAGSAPAPDVTAGRTPSTTLDATPFIPSSGGLRKLAAAAQDCRGCPLFAHATQAVFGEGAAGAGLLMIGEQPGDQEDRAGRPFVGPAGRLLDRALAEAGIDRAQVYVTNAVKHFKFEERGKRRIHKKPSTGEVRACQPWLAAEIARVKPRVVICLGATALFALAGPGVQLTKSRGQWLQTDLADRVIATTHPSAVLRVREPEQREQAFRDLVRDLRLAARGLHGRPPR